jgi:predicted transposase YdaD
VRASPGLAPRASLTPGIDQQALGSLRAAIAQRAPRATLGDLLAITYVIAGRRWPADLLASVLRSREMEESSTYRELIETGFRRGHEQGREEGRAAGREAELRRAILDLARARLASVPDVLPAQLEAIGAEELHSLFVELLHASDDDAFLALLSPLR